MFILDTVYNEIREQLGSFEPERGGALYGIRCYPCVTHFEYDHAAETTGASYIPSVQLIGNVQRVESETGLEFKGIIHSHPTGLTRPSGQDEWAASKFFEINPHRSSIAMPIVQVLVAGAAMPARFLHWYRVERSRSNVGHVRPRTPGRTPAPSGREQVAVIVIPDAYHVIPLDEHVRWLTQHLLETTGRRFDIARTPQLLQMHGADLFGLVATADDGAELMYFASMAYPVAAPLILHRNGPDTRSLRFEWDGTTDVVPSLEQVANALKGEWEASSPGTVTNRTLNKLFY